MPSTTPTTKPSIVKTHLVVAAGSTKATKMPVNNSPKTTRFARPSRSVRPANSEPKAPIRFPNARVITKNVKLMCRFWRISVDTEPPTYSS